MYGLLLILHLAAAVLFIGGLFHQLVIWGLARRSLPPATQDTVEAVLMPLHRHLLHGAALVLYVCGAGMAWRYRALLAAPFDSQFATLLSLKILLAISVLLHYVGLALLSRRGRLTPARRRAINASVLLHGLAILVLAKAMFHF